MYLSKQNPYFEMTSYNLVWLKVILVLLKHVIWLVTLPYNVDYVDIALGTTLKFHRCRLADR